MIGLRTARVVVVDNDPDEGMAIVAALSTFGAGISFFTGELEKLPRKRLTGVRLLVLDMNLLDIDLGEVRAVLSPLIAFLNKLIAKNSKPFAIIAWTKHLEYIEEFKKMLYETRPDLKPFIMFNIQKNDVKEDDGSGDFDSKKILNRLRKEAKSWFPFDLLMDWEQRVHDATTETIAALVNIAGESTGDWQGEMTKLLSSLTLESGGKRIGKEEGILTCFYDSLNPIHEDFLGSLPIDHTYLTSQSKRLQAAIDKEIGSRNNHKKSLLTGAQCSELNRMLCVAYPKSGEHALRPGNIYLKKGWGNTDYPINAQNISHLALGKDMTNRPATAEKWARMIYKCIPACVEITPLCDYSQGKTVYCRLMLGLLVPKAFPNFLKPQRSTPFIREIGPIHIKRSGSCPVSGDYILALNSKYVVGILSSKMAGKTEACRLKKQVLTDIQHWFSSQAARPGYVSVCDTF